MSARRPRPRVARPAPPRSLAWRLLRAVLVGLVAAWFLFEEFGWRPLAAWIGRLATWPPWALIETRIAALPPRWALALFLVPVALLLPVKLIALGLIGDGKAFAGFAVIVAAKLLGTALGGRLYLLTRPALMQVRRFARAVAWWRLQRRRLRHLLEASAGWRSLRDAFRRWRARLHGARTDVR